MRRSRKPIVIASRTSRLARIQAERVGHVLGKLHPSIRIEYRWISSEGDQHADQPLASIGGKGLFTRSLERAVLAGDADLAVHSLKDLPAGDAPGLTIAAVPRRGDVRDCLITRTGSPTLAELPANAVVGTSSPRRAAQVLRIRPDLRVEPIRGNVDTRLNKVLGADATYDAALLAAAGLTRLGQAEHAKQTVPLDQILPAACQGALAIQCRADDHVTLTRCLPLNDATAATRAHAERELVAGLEADCESPLAVLCEAIDVPPEASRRSTDSHWFRLRARVLSGDGSRCIEADQTRRPKDLRRLVRDVLAELESHGARELLAPAHPQANTSARPLTDQPAPPAMRPVSAAGSATGR